MVLKGNLLFNGDFETGTTEGWEQEPFGKVCESNLIASDDAKYRGNYGGKIIANKDSASAYFAYNKVCSFEEYEAYLFIMYANKKADGFMTGILYGLDEKGNLIWDYGVGYNNEKDTWRAYNILLRQFGESTHFKIGLYDYIQNQGEFDYIDEVKLLPVRSIKSVTLAENRWFNDVTSNKTWYSVLGCIGRCKLVSIVKTSDVAGTDPTLDIDIYVHTFWMRAVYIRIQHNQIAGAGQDIIEVELPEASYISIDYTLGGTNPKFDIDHLLRIYPLADAGYSVGSSGTAL